MRKQKRVCISFLGNALHDSRIINLSNSLQEDGYSISVISFDWFISDKEFFDSTYKVFKLHKSGTNLFFYLKFAFILTKELIKTKSDIYFAEDIYTLPFVSIIASLRKSKIYYNSRELYAFLGGLRNRPLLQKIVRLIEKFFIKRANLVLTTGEMDSEFLENYYEIKNTVVMRNIPLLQSPQNPVDYHEMFGIPQNHLVLIYQGVLLEGRGIPLILRVMKEIPETSLIILGDGEQKKSFINIATSLGISYRVFFLGAINQKELINYTSGGDIGLALIENISVSYYHALPNKLFEYIMAGLPVLSSNLPQMKKIVDDYKVGEVIDLEHPEKINSTIRKWSSDVKLFLSLKQNCINASQELNWQKEYERVKNILFDDER